MNAERLNRHLIVMNTSFTKVQCIAIGAALVVVSALVAVPASGANGHEVGVEVKPVWVEKLANAPGKTLTVVTVTYAPGGKSGKHHHAGSVFAYVLSGAIRSENSATGPVKVYKAGESFFEQTGSEHRERECERNGAGEYAGGVRRR